MGNKNLVPIEVGDTKVIGEKEYALTDEGVLEMQVPVPVFKRYTDAGLAAKERQLVAELAEVRALRAKITELSSQ